MRVGSKRLLWLILATPALVGASAPPEIPHQRTSEVFAPFAFDIGDNGESVLTSKTQGPFCIGYLVGQNNFQQAADPSTTQGQATLQNFITVLIQSSGVLEISSHGNPNVFGVEAFPALANHATTIAQARTDPSFIAAQTKITDVYENSSNENYVANPGELVVAVSAGTGLLETNQYPNIAVLSPFFTRLQNKGDIQSKAKESSHALIFANACESAGLSTGLGQTQGLLRDFVGFAKLCPFSVFGLKSGGATTTSDVLNTMAGQTSYNNTYGNHPFTDGFALAQQDLGNAIK